jgi:hypothetical protein
VIVPDPSARYSEDTVELLAAAIASARRDDVFTEVEWNGSHWDSLRDAYRADAVSALDALAAAGALLPEGAEQRTEWGVWWYGLVGNGIHLTREGFTSKRMAEDYAPSRIGDYGITRYEIWKREHRNWADGSSWSGPWSPIPPEPKDGTDARADHA